MVVAGLFLILLCPAIAALGLWSAQFMPGCTGGSSGPVSGCLVNGVNFNWFIHLATLAFLASFVTVPVGVLVALAGATMLILRAREKQKRPYGIYDSQGKLLSPSAAAAAVNQFDREACDTLLRKFGQPLSAEAEPLSAVRLRCIAALGASLNE